MKKQNIIILSNGLTTDIMIDGRVYGDGVVKVEFVHDCQDKRNDSRLLITTDRTPLEGSTNIDEKLGFMKKCKEYAVEKLEG